MPPFEHEDVVGLFAALDLDNEGSNIEARLPLTGVSVKALVFDFIAEVKLSQCYQNNRSDPVEAIYHFPVGEAACVCDFIAEYEDGTTVRGILKKKEDAKKKYHEAISHGKQANLLQSVRSDIFSLNVGNLPPGGHVKITITYITSLKAEGDSAAFVLPTCIAPRYSPRSESLEADDALAMAPPHLPVKLYGLDIDVKFSTCSDIKSLKCPSHPEESSFTSEIRENEASVSFRDIPMDRDLVLLMKEDKAHQPRACIEISDDGSVAGFVTIFPQIEFQDVPREIIFVVDRSGSMCWNGGSMGKMQIQQASDALLLFLRSLPSSCIFNVVGFGSRHESLFSRPMPFNDKTLEEASSYAHGMEANFGGTEIMAPLKDVFERKLAPGVERQVFVLTDGQVSNDLQVFNLIREHCSARNKKGKTAKCRLFALGIGAGVSRHLVTGMARAGHGTARFVEGGDETSLRSKVLGQLKQALQPALDDVSIQWKFASESKSDKSKRATKCPEEVKEPVKTLLGYRSPSADDPPASTNLVPLSTYPSNIPPIFNQERFLSFAIFPTDMKDIPESVTIKCASPDGPLETTLKISDEEVFHGSIAHKMAAREAIREYEDGRKGRGRFGSERLGSSGSTSSSSITGSEALRLALQNNLASEQSSFIAVLERPVVKAGVEAERQVIPQYLPSFDADSYVHRQERFRSAACSINQMGDFSAAALPGAGAGAGTSRAAGQSFNSMPRAYASAKRLSSTTFSPEAASFHLSAGQSMGMKKSAGILPDFSGVGTFFENAIAMPRTLFSRRSAKHSLSLQQPPPHCRATTSSTKIAAQSMECYAAPPEYQGDESSASSDDDQLMKLCMLQKANGSFPLTDTLAEYAGLTLGAMKSLASQAFAPEASSASLDSNVFATSLAVAIMRKRFGSQKDIWELQERKAVDYIRKTSGLSNIDIEAVVSKLQSSL